MEDKLTCRNCGYSDTLDGFDVIGACPGSVFCNNCGEEIEASTGIPSPLCGECAACKELKKDGHFVALQLDRKFKRDKLDPASE